MAKRMRFCPRCMNMIRKNDEKCSSCGLEVSAMQELLDRQQDLNARAAAEKAQLEDQESEKEQVTIDDNGVIVGTAEVLSSEGESENPCICPQYNSI